MALSVIALILSAGAACGYIPSKATTVTWLFVSSSAMRKWKYPAELKMT